MMSSTHNPILLIRLLNFRMFPVISTLILLVGCAVRTPEQQSKHDDAHYSSALSPYLRDLKPGVSRKEVEDYLNAKRIKFGRGCCAATTLNSYTPNRALVDTLDDWVPLREEMRPWPCGTADVSIAFEFKRTRPNNGTRRLEVDDSDTLQEIHIMKSIDCL